MRNNFFVNEVDKIVQVELTQCQWAIIDLIDLDLIASYRWHAVWAPCNESYYASAGLRIGGKCKTLRMHRLIMGLDFGDKRQVDHIYHKTLDNRRSQLRVVTERGNKQNKKKLGTSIYPGVSWDKQRQKWLAQIQVDGVQRHAGRFDDELEAALAYRRALASLTTSRNNT